MAKLTKDELIEAFKEMTLIELSEFVKEFEEVFEVTAAARSPLLLQVPLALRLLSKRRTSSTSFSKTLAPRRSA